MNITTINHYGETIITVDNFWSDKKCDEFITLSESMGYSEALVQTDLGPRRINHIRNNLRIIHDDVLLAHELWQSISSIAPSNVGNSTSIGLNERFRFYKYTQGQSFRRHRDQSYVRNKYECSFYTFLIYLNDDFEGGATTFYDLKIAPKKGKALIFYHPLEHAGEVITYGTKYILRTDIMYRFTTGNSSMHSEKIPGYT